MTQNYLKAPESPQINAFLAAAGWNLKKMMIKLKNDTRVWVLIDFKTKTNPRILQHLQNLFGPLLGQIRA